MKGGDFADDKDYIVVGGRHILQRQIAIAEKYIINDNGRDT